MGHVRKHGVWYVLVALLVATVFVWAVLFRLETSDELVVTFLDVGQGDAIFIEAPNGNQMLIDGGRGKEVIRALSRVMPFYDRSIDVVVATHPDQDHIGGLVDVIERFDVEKVFRSGAVNDTSVYWAFNETLQGKSVEQVLARRGMRVILQEGIIFEILFPDRDVSLVDPNAASIIGKLSYGNHEFMLTGDAPKSIENYLVSLYGKKLESDVLKAGHHGSNTSSGENFVGFVSPEYAIISAGRDNRYGHPHQEVLNTFAQFNIPVFATSENGDIVFASNGSLLLFEE
ncbi:MAG: ComEC/Rec2 family competence protein [Candidatus Paceibacterota bacterium]